MNRFRDHITSILLNDESPISAKDEQKWSIAYKELEALQELLEKNKFTAASLQQTKIKSTLAEIERKISVLHEQRGQAADEGVGEFVLMYLTWECAMRLSKHLQDMGV